MIVRKMFVDWWLNQYILNKLLTCIKFQIEINCDADNQFNKNLNA